MAQATAGKEKKLIKEIRPQHTQEKFLSSAADIVFFGGSAGGGKSFSLLMNAARGITNSKYRAILFRKSYPEICNAGGLADESQQLYRALGGVFKKTTLDWYFPSGAKVSFRHLAKDEDKYKYQGSQIAFIGFDEATHFSEEQFWYLLSRNRSASGYKPKLVATMNPDPDSFIRKMIDWWIDEEGYARIERSGEIRYFIKIDGEMIWSSSKKELTAKYPGNLPKSFTFIHSSIYDNKALLDVNPEYLSNLMALHPVDRERLLRGNWKIRFEASKVFNRIWFEVVEAHEVPEGGAVVRFWDFAATERDVRGQEPCATAGVKMKKVMNSQGEEVYYIMDAIEERESPGKINELIMHTARIDGGTVKIRWEQEPGASGIRDTHHIKGLFSSVTLPSAYVGSTIVSHYDAEGILSNRDKVSRAKAFATAASQGRVKVVNAPWKDPYLSQLHNFPDFKFKDLVDASSGAFNQLSEMSIIDLLSAFE